MAFLRKKEIPPGSGRHYTYMQRSQREGKKVRSIHVRYIGTTAVPVKGRPRGPYGAQEVDLREIQFSKAQAVLVKSNLPYYVDGTGKEGHLYILRKQPERINIDPVTGKDL